MVRFGLRLLDDVGGPRELVDLAVWSEELGFDTVWFPHDTFRLNSWVLTSATARSTERVQIFARTNLYTSDPSEIATYVATLDALSGGRANVSIGLHTTDMLDWIGIPPGDVMTRTRETVEILRRLLAGEHVAYAGECFHWTERAFLRVPPPRANVPIYVCPFGERYLELSGEIGDGSLPMITPPESAAVMVDPILRGARRAGRDPESLDIVGFVWIAVSDDRTEAEEMMRDVAAYFGVYLDPPALATIGLTRDDFAAIHARVVAGDRAGGRALVTKQMLRLGVAGTPEDCVRQLRTLVDAGIRHISLGGPLGPRPREAIQTIATRILPAFR